MSKEEAHETTHTRPVDADIVWLPFDPYASEREFYRAHPYLIKEHKRWAKETQEKRIAELLEPCKPGHIEDY